MKESNKEWWKYQFKALGRWAVCMVAFGALIGVALIVKQCV